MCTATNDLGQITASNLQTIFPEQIDTLEKMVDDFLYPRHEDRYIADLSALFKKAVKQLPEKFASCSKEELAKMLFNGYANSCISQIQQDERYPKILKNLQSYFREPDFVEDRLKEVVLDRIKMLHSGVLEIAIGQALDIKLESCFLMKA